jgi:anti-anti-sigma factor
MTIQVRAVTVKQLPGIVSDQIEHDFLSELRSVLEVDRPRIVLNCSNLRSLNQPAIHLLLFCLEEAMKRNGDVRLAALPKASKAVLQSVGLDRLFKSFDTDAEAIKSFQSHSVWRSPFAGQQDASMQAAENAA